MKGVNCYMILTEISIFEIFVVAMVIILKFLTSSFKMQFYCDLFIQLSDYMIESQ